MTLETIAAVATSALISDALDSLGLRHQCLGWDIRPMTPGADLVGRAFTVSCVPVDAVPDVPYQGLLKALDQLGPGDIYVTTTRRSDEVAMWGELLSTAARAAGAVGALTDGLVRDTARVRALDFPVFARGTTPLDINGRFEVTGTGDELSLDGVAIAPGDLIVGDIDGVVVVPRSIESDVLAHVAEKAAGESLFRAAVRDGMAPSEAFKKFGVL